jgi:uncharacterized membrane protein
VLEQTALRCLGGYFHFDDHFMNAGVLFGLGWSMVLLGGLVVLPPAVGLAAGPVIVLGEPAIAAIDLGAGPLGTLWALANRSRDLEPVAGYWLAFTRRSVNFADGTRRRLPHTRGGLL